MSNIYYDPEKYGLRTLGEVEFSSGAYEFDLSVLWQDVETGAFYVADDSGCSCPSPFEGIGRGDLRKIGRLQDLIDYLDGRKRESYRYDAEDSPDDAAAIDADCAGLIQTYRKAAAA